MTTPRSARRTLAPCAAVAAAAALILSACGGGGTTTVTTGAAGAGSATLPQRTKATLVLDYLPNPVHAGIYRALAAGYYDRANLDLRVIPPTSTADTLRLIDAGKADFGIADGIDLADQISRGRDAQGVMAVVQRPLGGIISLRKAGITSPGQYAGKTVGITGVPSDEAVLDTIVAHGGGDPKQVRKVTVGFNGVQDTQNGKLDGFVGFYPSDGTQLRLTSDPPAPTTVFPFDTNGGPRYAGLVAFTTRARIARDPALVRAFVAATVHGYQDTLASPARSLRDLLAAVPTLKPALATAQFKAYLPLFQAGAPRYGRVAPAQSAALSRFLVGAGLIHTPIAPARYATNAFLPGPGN